jgi:peptide deformylase
MLTVVKYGTPVLRQRGTRIERVTPMVKKLIADMLDTMYGAKGIGLAAQQVGVPIQLLVIDVRGVTDRPSSLELKGAPADVAKFMPVVLMNPEITPIGEPTTAPEGCLSFPELYANVTRPDIVDVRGLDAEGHSIEFRCGGLLSRVVQHENDHLQGILFIDRMDKKTKEELRSELDLLQAETKAMLKQVPAGKT